MGEEILLDVLLCLGVVKDSLGVGRFEESDPLVGVVVGSGRLRREIEHQ